MHTAQKNLILAKILVWGDEGIIRNFAGFNSRMGKKAPGQDFNIKCRQKVQL